MRSIPSPGFIDAARAKVADRRAAFQVGDAQALEVDDACRDVIVSGLVLDLCPFG
ncbi:MAG: class I SAM-dependent methyltransferase [Alphaproteobacteria bacterium]